MPIEDQALLKWDEVSPTVSDNSGHVTVTSPDIFGNPFPVYFGQQTIIFEASDERHTVTCAIGVEVKGREEILLRYKITKSLNTTVIYSTP